MQRSFPAYLYSHGVGRKSLSYTHYPANVKASVISTVILAESYLQALSRFIFLISKAALTARSRRHCPASLVTCNKSVTCRWEQLAFISFPPFPIGHYDWSRDVIHRLCIYFHTGLHNGIRTGLQFLLLLDWAVSQWIGGALALGGWIRFLPWSVSRCTDRSRPCPGIFIMGQKQQTLNITQ